MRKSVVHERTDLMTSETRLRNESSSNIRVILEPWSEEVVLGVGDCWILETDSELGIPELTFLDGAIVIACMSICIRSENGPIIWKKWDWG